MCVITALAISVLFDKAQTISANDGLLEMLYSFKASSAVATILFALLEDFDQNPHHN